MAEWINTPVIIIAVLTLLGILWKAASWQGSVNADLSAWKASTDRERAEWKDQAERGRAEWQQQAERDRAEWKEQVERGRAESQQQAERDQAEWKEQAERDRAEWKEQAERDRSVTQEFMREIRDDIKNIFSRLGPAPVVGKSPLQLTDFGETIAAHVAAYQWAQSLAPTLIDRVEGKQPFQIDEFCDSYVSNELDEAMETLVSSASYQHALSKDGVRSVLRVVLRDELLRMTSGGTVSQQG